MYIKKEHTLWTGQRIKDHLSVFGTQTKEMILQTICLSYINSDAIEKAVNEGYIRFCSMSEKYYL